MVNTVLINRVTRQPGNLYIDDHLHDGVNQQSRLVKVSVDSNGSLAIPHTLTFHPKWVEMKEAKGLDVNQAGVNLPSNAQAVFLQVQERVVAEAAVAPDVGTPLALTFSLGGNPAAGTGIVYVWCVAPTQQGATDYVYFTFHVGRTHSSPK